MSDRGDHLPNGLDVLKERLEHVIRGQSRMESKLDQIENDVRSQFVTRNEFDRVVSNMVTSDRYWLVEKLVFGLAGLILVATMIALISTVIKQ